MKTHIYKIKSLTKEQIELKKEDKFEFKHLDDEQKNLYYLNVRMILNIHLIIVIVINKTDILFKKGFILMNMLIVKKDLMKKNYHQLINFIVH